MLISILAPHTQGTDISVSKIPEGTKYIKYEVHDSDSNSVAAVVVTDCVTGTENICGLIDGRKYTVTASALDEQKKLIEKSEERTVIPNFVPGKCISYIHPYDSAFGPAGRFIGSPCIAKLSNGDLVASHDLFLESFPNRFGVDFRDKNSYERCVTKIYKSSDNGQTWEFLTDVHCCTFGKMFLFRDKLYMIGLSADADMILNDPYNLEERNSGGRAEQKGLEIKIFCSENGGYTWSEPCSITKGICAGSFHKAVTPVIEHEGRLWVAFDTPKNAETGFGLGIASIDAESDIMDEKNWVVSTPFLYYDMNWDGTVDGVWSYMMEEANVVAGTDGEIYVIARYNSVNYSAEFINSDDDGLKAVIAKADKNNPAKPLEFVKMTHFIGGLSKFTINYDAETKKYYSLVSRATGNMCCQRNILSLVSSEDLFSWKIERDCINLMDMNWYQNCQEAGMYYCDWLIDGNDIIAVCRTALHDCINYHDANMMTFHRFKDFRENNYN